MADAWIYTEYLDGVAAQTAAALAELGFHPRRFTPNGTLRPADTGESRNPEVAIVVGMTEVCARLRGDEDLMDVPVVLAVEPGQMDDALESDDADEIIIVPFATAELRARITRARRSATGTDRDEVLRIDGLEINVATYQITVDGEPVDFTYMEYELLKFLASHPNRVFTREALLSRVWGYDYFGGVRTVDVHVRRVRAKLGTHHAARLVTVRSVGYRFEA